MRFCARDRFSFNTMLEKILVIPYFISALNFSSPVYSEQILPQLADSYSRNVNVTLSSSCPSMSKARSIIPKYSLENAVAEFESYADIDTRSGNMEIKASTDFFIRAYNSKAKQKYKISLTLRKEIRKFLEGGGFDIIELYEMNGKHELHSKPSAIIYSDRKNTYVVYDLEGTNNLADGVFDYIQCHSGWQPNLVLRIGENILKRRVMDRLIENGLVPPQPKSKRRNLNL